MRSKIYIAVLLAALAACSFTMYVQNHVIQRQRAVIMDLFQGCVAQD